MAQRKGEPQMGERGAVLVTGGSGYIAGFCIAQLLNEGWTVRTTVRSLSREPEVRKSLEPLCKPDDRLTFHTAELMDDAGWPKAMQGAEYVMHVASPLPSADPRNADDLIIPARDGTLRVLKAAKAAGVKRVVETSSVAAIAYGRGGRATPHTEADWSDETNLKDIGPYERSKTIAERAAWDWSKREGGAMELCMVNPGAVLGPVLGKDFSASLEIVKLILEGALPACPRFGFPIVDVRDVADLHYRAMLAPSAPGQRYIAANGFMWMSDVAKVLKAGLPDRAKKIPTTDLPDLMLRISALFNPIVRGRLFELGKRRDASSEKAKRELGWAPRAPDVSIMDAANSMIALNIV
jgi:dihydroflavonol-4-reductase